jgi:SAM-dependent methyltransferase
VVSRFRTLPIVPVAKGLATYVPGVWRAFRPRSAGPDVQAEYCYGVWLKHMTLLVAHGYCEGVPRTVSELGPGDSLGVGIAALLTGSSEYHALDVVPYSTSQRTLCMFDDLVEMFERRAPRPHKGWPDIDSYLGPGLFPEHIFDEEALNESLQPERVAAVRAAVASPGRPADGILVTYSVPWTDGAVEHADSVDLVLSHAVLEHVADLAGTYGALARLVQPGGWMTHQIDFRSHGICEPWNGHRAYGDRLWKLIVGRRPFMLNREPPSVHLDLMRNSGVEVVASLVNISSTGLGRSRVAPRWRAFENDDLQTEGAFVVTRKPR